MVVPLGPGKFYGRSLPRPRIYTDVKFNDERVDPPVSVTDPLMSWANEAHWSMGGLSFQRHRLQGRIEGNIKKLRSERERAFKKRDKTRKEVESPVAPAAPVAVKRKRRMVEEVEEEEEVEEVEYKRRTVRKLKDEFDKVATTPRMVSPLKNVDDEPERVVERVDRGRGRGIGRRLVKGLKALKTGGKRTSPRLFKSLLS